MQLPIGSSSQRLERILRRHAHQFSRLVRRRFTRVEGNIRVNCPQKRSRDNKGAVALAAVTVVLVSGACIQNSVAYAAGQNQEPGQKSVRPHRSAKPEFTGSNGSQTGIASFQGNFTTIGAPPGQIIALYRMPDCSLSLATASYDLGAGTYTQTGDTPSYERLLHSEAQLTTTADVFASGCPTQPSAGIGSAPAVFAGTTTTGIHVFAAVGETASTNNGLYVIAGTTTFTVTSFAFAAAGVLTAADLNGDGNGDLVVTNNTLSNSGTGAVSVLLGNADGTFQTAVTYPTAGTGAVAAVIDDVNGDGKLDIVSVSNTQQISVLLGKGDGTFASAQSFATPTLPGYTSNTSTPIVNLITADLRHIGKKDIICSDGAVLLGNGDGTFTPASAPAFPYATGTSDFGPNLASGDFNNDGKPDVVLSTGSNILIYLGKGDGTFTPGNSYATINSYGFVAVNDLDGDGNADIYVGLGGGLAYSGDSAEPNMSYALMGHGDGTFSGAPTILGAYSGNNLGDVNGDGLPDLITLAPGPTNTPSNFTVQLGTDTGAFNPTSSFTAPASFALNGKTITGANTAGVSNLVVADINGDGKADLVFVDNGLNNTVGALNPLPVYFVALSNGDGTFASPMPYAFPAIAPGGSGFDNNLVAGSLFVGNFTGSGHSDLIFGFTDTIGGSGVTDPYVGGFVVIPGNGDGTFKTPIITTTFSSPTAQNFPPVATIVSATDINGDGKTDLLATISTGVVDANSTSELALFLSKGDGTFQAPTTITTAANPGLIFDDPLLLVDINKDGKLDLLCLGETTDSQAELAISLGNGDGTFAAPTILNLDGGDAIRSSGFAAADFDGDGNIDIALLNTEEISGIYYGKGDGTFTSVPSNGLSYPKDLINLFAGGPAVAGDFNHDGKPDILAGNVVLLNIYGSSPVTPTTTATTTALTASGATITAGASVTFTATITGASGSTGTPTGTVTFLDGATTLGTGTLSTSGVATYSTSTLATGTHSITAKYGGDSNFAASTSTAVTVTVQAAVPPSFTLSASPGSLSIAPGATGTTTVSVTPAGGFSQAVTFACSGLPSEATCTFAPATVTPGASAVTTTLTISTTAAQAAERSGIYRSGITGLLALGSLLLFAMPRSKRGIRWGGWLALALAVILAGGLISCGGGGSGGGGTTPTNPGTPAGTSTITVTATSGSLNPTTSLQLTVE